jgi:lipid-binding SYLF domain-containing protein
MSTLRLRKLPLVTGAIVVAGPLAAAADDLADAQEQINEAIGVVNDMKSDAEFAQLLNRAKGVFIIPDYAQAALGVGGEGGEGIVLVRDGQELGAGWSAPAFYNMGGISAGAQVGVEAGSVAMLLMSDEAVRPFVEEENNFTLDANAGLTIVNWSGKAQASTIDGDVVIWADTEGAFVGLNVAVSDINQDEDENRAYYGPDTSTAEILTGDVSTERAAALREQLSG